MEHGKKNSSTYLYCDFSFTAEKYTYYENISYYEALVVYEDRQLDDYPSAAALNIGYVFSNDVEQIRPFIYGGINGGIRHVGFKDEFYILSNSGNYSVDLPNSGYTKLNIGGGVMIPLSDSGELKISADANPPSLHIGIGLVNWSKAKKIMNMNRIKILLFLFCATTTIYGQDHLTLQENGLFQWQKVYEANSTNDLTSDLMTSVVLNNIIVIDENSFKGELLAAPNWRQAMIDAGKKANEHSNWNKKLRPKGNSFGRNQRRSLSSNCTRTQICVQRSW